jgi:reprolysin-like metallo-peptidase family M12B
MKWIAVVLLAIALSFSVAPRAAAQCALSGFNNLPSYTPIYLGPLMYYYAYNFTDVGNALVAASVTWNITDAHDRIGGYGGQTNSDCPLGQSAPQIGAYNFYAQPYCGTAVAYGFHNPSSGALAFTDYYPGQCAGCGTKSISINTAVAWAIIPADGQYDVQSVVAHEFGHMLGFSHIYGNQCSEFSGYSCAVDPDRNTMQRYTAPGFGETCGRDLTGIDIANANYLY